MVKQTIQIFARLKPTKGKKGQYEVYEDSEGAGSFLSFNIPRDISDGIVNNKRELFKFSFEKVFDVETRQDEVFDVVARPVIDNVLEGYNGTIFAYGQTGSGKTFTITGGAERFADRGIIPRSLSYVFDYYQQHVDCEFTTLISYLEIYNECGYDLLDPKHDAAKLDDLPKVTLMEDSDQNIHLKNLSTHQANNEEQALNLLFLGDTNRMIAETPMNQASTRSHCIFTIHIMSRTSGSATVRRSKLHLVDLAGSERVSKSGVNGILLTEAKYINLSLHYLEQVIIALSEARRQHIPYRNSMMTSVLRDSLGGNCMTTMIANCATDRANIDETISTCRFAQRVALIKNDAILNEELDPKLMIEKLKREVQQLKDELTLATGEQRTDTLTDDEQHRCEDLINAYLDDSDPESVLPVGSDLRQVKYCFYLLKRRVAEQREAVHHVDNTSDNDELQQLKNILSQRDHEINILIAMLKKEKAKNSLSAGDGETERTLTPERVSGTNNKHGNTGRKWTVTQQQQQQQQQLSSDSDILGRMSAGRQEAFKLFCRDYEHSETIERNKRTLKPLTIEAKQLGEQLAQTRFNINRLKGLMKQQQALLAAAGVVDFEAREPTTEERELKQQLEQENIKYKSIVKQLQKLKNEIEHLQHLLEMARVKLLKDFETWWTQQTTDTPAQSPSPESSLHCRTSLSLPALTSIATHAHETSVLAGSTPGRRGDSTSSAGRNVHSASSSGSGVHSTQSHIPLTGDSEADADILAFLQARQKVIRQAESGRNQSQ